MSIFRAAWFMYTAEKSLVLRTCMFVLHVCRIFVPNCVHRGMIFFFGKTLNSGW